MATFMRLIPTAAVLPGVIKREKYAVLPLWPMVIYMSAASTGQYMRSLKKIKIAFGNHESTAAEPYLLSGVGKLVGRTHSAGDRVGAGVERSGVGPLVGARCGRQVTRYPLYLARDRRQTSPSTGGRPQVPPPRL